MRPEIIREHVRRSRAAQHLPETVADAVVLGRVGALLERAA